MTKLLMLVALAMLVVACAQNAQPAQQGPRRMSPDQISAMMQASIDACNGKNANDTCVLTTPRGTMNGTCQTFNETLRCRGQFGQYNGSRYRGAND